MDGRKKWMQTAIPENVISTFLFDAIVALVLFWVIFFSLDIF